MSVFGVTPTFLAFLRHEEGWRAEPYLDQAGYPTIGFGHRIPSMTHPPLTLAEGVELLAKDVGFKQRSAVWLSPGLLTEPECRMSAILDFCFNAGEVAYAKSTLRKCVDAKDWAGAGVQMRKWVWATKQPSGERFKVTALVRRRGITAQWLETGLC